MTAKKTKTTDEFLNVMAAIDFIAKMSDDAYLTTDEAALYLRLSPTTLERMRARPGGPRYVQGGEAGCQGTNQKIVYRLGDLREWQKSRLVTSTNAAAIRKGMLMPSFRDTFTRLPYWINAAGQACGRVFDDTPDDYLKNRTSMSSAWLSISEALSKPWVSKAKREPLAVAYKELLLKEMQVVQQQDS